MRVTKTLFIVSNFLFAHQKYCMFNQAFSSPNTLQAMFDCHTELVFGKSGIFGKVKSVSFCIAAVSEFWIKA